MDRPAPPAAGVVPPACPIEAGDGGRSSFPVSLYKQLCSAFRSFLPADLFSRPLHLHPESTSISKRISIVLAQSRQRHVRLHARRLAFHLAGSNASTAPTSIESTSPVPVPAALPCRQSCVDSSVHLHGTVWVHVPHCIVPTYMNNALPGGRCHTGAFTHVNVP